MAAPRVESGFEGGHGSHWDAVLDDPGELPKLVSAAYKRGQTREGGVVILAEGAADARVRTLPLGDQGLEARIVELAITGKPKPAIATVFPHLAPAGSALDVIPQAIIEWGRDGFEAEVKVMLAGEDAAVAFFAVDYLENRSRYRSGGPLRASLSAIAYTSGIISPAARMEDLAGAKVDVSRASIVAALKDSERAPYYDDDFFLQGPVVSCVPFSYAPWGEGALLQLDLEGIGATPVFVRKKDYPHGWPKAGEFVAAYSWLQGRLRG